MAKFKGKDPKKFPIVVPQELLTAMRLTWSAIGNDICDEVSNISNLEAIEVILDADYMPAYGGAKGKEMAALVDAWCKEYELEDVYKAIAAVATFA